MSEHFKTRHEYPSPSEEIHIASNNKSISIRRDPHILLHNMCKKKGFYLNWDRRYLDTPTWAHILEFFARNPMPMSVPVTNMEIWPWKDGTKERRDFCVKLIIFISSRLKG